VTLQGTAQHFLGAGSPSGLPVYLENATLRAEFEADDAVGVRLARLVHLAGAAPFAWVNDPAAVGQTFALWQARGLLADGTPYSVGPSSAAAFQVRTTTLPPDGDAALLMHWSGVPIPGAAAGDLLDVVLIAYIAATDPSELRWRVTVRRSAGESASIDEIDAPITFWASPVATRAGSTALESAKRARVLAPNNFQSGLWGNTQESALYQWLPGGIYRQAHPHGTGLGSSHGAWQVQQWCAVAGMDPQHSASYRQILHLGTRDTDGRLKRLLLQGYPTAGVTDGRLGWRVTHIPQWSGYPATDLEADATELGNVYVSRFPVSMAVLRAQSAAWDHDACEYYRDWVRRSGTGGTPRQFAEDRSALRDGRPLLGMILTPHTDSGASLYGKFVAEAAEFGAMLDGAHSAYPLFQFWSNWQKDPATDEGGITLVNPGTDVAAYVDDGLVAAIVAARAAGGRVAIYTYGVSVEIDRGWPEVAGAATQVYQRDGTPALLTAHLWDYGHPDTVAALRLFYAAIAATVRPDGIYSDSISGGHGFIAYDPPAPLERGHFEHGGRHWQRGKRDILRAIRDALRDHSPVGPADADVFALSEVPEELLFHGHRSAIDATQEGYIPVPGSMALAEEHLRNYGVDDVPPQSRPMTPSTWSQVYHRWRPSFRHPIPLTTVPLIGSGYHPSGSAYPGRIESISEEHAFYLQNLRGPVTIENVHAKDLGRTFCQFTARAKEGPPSIGDVTVRDCVIEDACIAQADGFKGGSAITLCGRAEGTFLFERNVYRAGFRPERQRLTTKGLPYGTGAFTAWEEGGGGMNGTLVLRDNEFAFAPGCGDRPVVSIGGCERVLLVGANKIVSGGKQPALSLDPVNNQGQLVSSANGPTYLAPATVIEGAVLIGGKPADPARLAELRKERDEPPAEAPAEAPVDGADPEDG
jgi:hypothetical protein